jgi:hypothetical protein
MQHTRRHVLEQQAFGLTGLAFAWLLRADDLRAAPAKPALERPAYDLLPKPPAREPRAKAMISMFMQGGPSHHDLFDPKPELTRRHLQEFPGDVTYDNAAEASAKLFASPWKFSRHGRCGMELSELVPCLGGVADEICLIRSMRTGVNNHGQSINALNTGRITPGRPALGSWITYALGTESQELPAFVVLTDPGGVPVLGVDNWRAGFLPSLYQGTVIRPREPRILNLDPPPELAGLPQRRMLDLIERVNRDYETLHPGETDLSARIHAYELAARMQVAAREAIDLSGETRATRALYGLDDPVTADYGARCLIARRLVERGVRFVQIHTGNQTWDHHGGIEKRLPAVCQRTDRPAAALVRDLKDRGMLDTTLVHWGGEMGRLPVIQNEQNIGRDHNTYGFSMWLAGGGVQGGLVYGATDEFGHHAVENVVHHFDYHATLLHLFGLDRDRTTFRRPTGTDGLVAGDEGRIVWDILTAGSPA